jgi:hypothetical protein
MKTKSQNQSGFSHIFIPFVIIIGTAIFGVYLLVAGHADSPNVTPIAPNTVLPADSQNCAHPHGTFTISGNHIYDNAGQVFMPYGITVFGLTEQDWQPNLSTDEAQINDMASNWCVNTVRIQVSPTDLLSDPTPGYTYNTTFMAAINDEVQTAFKDNLNVVLTAQTENYNAIPNPTAQTLAYWSVVSKYYKGVHDMFFDLYNEPRLKVDNADGSANVATTWNLWKNGGTYDGTNYVGMQTLVSDLRQAGIQRIFWVEGPYTASTLNLASQYSITGGNIVYDIHHPGGSATTVQWDSDFGNLAATQPVVVGEWTQWAGGFCWSNAATAIPSFFSYISSKQIGLVAWTLEPDVLIQNTNLNLPTNINTDFTCGSGQDEGAGRLLANYFRAENSS